MNRQMTERTDPAGKPAPVQRKLTAGAMAVAGAAIAGVLAVTGSWYTIKQTERGVLLRNGAYVSTEQPGLHFKLPWLETVVKISTQTHNYTYEKVNSYSADQQPADIKISVTLRADPGRVGELHSRFSDLESAVSRLITPTMNQQLKIIFGQYTAARAISERAMLNTRVQEAVTHAMKDDPVLIIEGVQIEDIEFSKEYIRSVEQRMQAEVEVQRLQQQVRQAEQQANITKTRAQAEADAVVARATAEATATKLRGEAEAAAVKAKGDALRDNPGLVQLIQAERWNGQLPTTMLPNTAVPMLSIDPKPAPKAD